MDCWSPIRTIILFLFAAGSLVAQQPSVEPVRPLDFGVVLRGMRAVVDYRDLRAAEFAVHGRPGAYVRLMIIDGKDLSLQTGESMRIRVRSSLCAYSLDHGATWTEFSNEGIVEHLVFPESASPTSEILVRVGGDLTVDDEQQRGTYTMRIDVVADYYRHNPLLPESATEAQP